MYGSTPFCLVNNKVLDLGKYCEFDQKLIGYVSVFIPGAVCTPSAAQGTWLTRELVFYKGPGSTHQYTEPWCAAPFADCSAAVTLQSGSLTTKSALPCCSADRARLHNSGGWAAQYLKGQWLQVALTGVTKITALATQGHPYQRSKRWTIQFLLYSRCNETAGSWQPYNKVKGNIS